MDSNHRIVCHYFMQLWEFNNEIKNLNYEINSDGKLELIDITDKDGMRIYKRGLIYIISKAFYELCWEKVRLFQILIYQHLIKTVFSK